MTIEIANRLCAYRKQHGMSQEELAAQIGVSRQAVSKWERAEASPDTDNLILLSKIYNVTLDTLLNIDPPAPMIETEVVEPDIEDAPEPTAEAPMPMQIRDEQREARQERARRLYMIPYPVICVIAYLVFGFLGICGGWVYGWLVMFSIPLYYTLIDAVVKRKPSHFAYPVLVVWLYLWIGFRFGAWHPAWLVFLTIPVYYGIAEALKK